MAVGAPYNAGAVIGAGVPWERRTGVYGVRPFPVAELVVRGQ